MLFEEICIGYKDSVKILNHICQVSSTDYCNYLSNRIISSTNFNAQFSLFINNMFVTLLSSTCFEH